MENSKKIKILLVEDEQAIVEMYQVQFQSEGMEVAVAKNVDDGLELVESESPDVVLLDLILPARGSVIDPSNRGGFLILEKVHSSLQLKKIPVLVLSNLDTPQDRERARMLGAKGYYIKAQLLPKEISTLVKNVVK